MDLTCGQRSPQRSYPCLSLHTDLPRPSWPARSHHHGPRSINHSAPGNLDYGKCSGLRHCSRLSPTYHCLPGTLVCGPDKRLNQHHQALNKVSVVQQAVGERERDHVTDLASERREQKQLSTCGAPAERRATLPSSRRKGRCRSVRSTLLPVEGGAPRN